MRRTHLCFVVTSCHPLSCWNMKWTKIKKLVQGYLVDAIFVVYPDFYCCFFSLYISISGIQFLCVMLNFVRHTIIANQIIGRSNSHIWPKIRFIISIVYQWFVCESREYKQSYFNSFLHWFDHWSKRHRLIIPNMSNSNWFFFFSFRFHSDLWFPLSGEVVALCVFRKSQKCQTLGN